MRYSITDFLTEFPNDDACLDYVFKKRYGKSGSSGYYRIKGRKSYVNTEGHQIHPLKGTIFEKSSTPLHKWFYALFLFSKAKNGVAALELSRQLKVTRKTAWRMCSKIRSIMDDREPKLSGTVEGDETFIGGRKWFGNGGRGKTPVIGLVQRGGKVKALAVEHRQTHIIINNILGNVERGSRIISDQFGAYAKMSRMGYWHDSVNHGVREYVRGDIHTNTIEGFWSLMKRSFHGTHHSISKKHLQSYVDVFCFYYNHREDAWQELLERL